MNFVINDKKFYYAFETKHRGIRELILKRLKIYLFFGEPLKTIYDESLVLGLGCDHGEWIELIQKTT